MLAAVEDADAGGRAHFVAGEDKEVAVELLDIEGEMAGALRGVEDGDGAGGAGAVEEFGDGVEGAEAVGDVREGNDFRGAGEKLVEGSEVEGAGFGEDGDEVEMDGEAVGEELPRDKVAVVLHLSEEDAITGLKELGEGVG